MAQQSYPAEQLRQMTESIFTSAGVPEKDAALVTDNLLMADVWGMPSHGLMRVMPYVERIRKGLTKVEPKLSHEAVAENMFRVDGAGALGQVATMYALKLCLEQTGKSGNAFATVNHMNHFGMAGYYTKIAAKEGYLALATTNASPTMAPYGGLDPLLGTNPFCVSFGAGKYDNFTLDVATTATARGKIRMYEQEGKKLPVGWAVDRNGNDTTDPSEALKGTMLPMGAHKGYGLSMIVDMLSGIMSGADLSYEAKSMFDADVPANTGCFLCVLDISRFVPKDIFLERVEAWFDTIKACRVRPGFLEVLLPGEIENRRLAQSDGQVLLSDKTYEKLCALHAELSGT